jgi:hypothetical protein
MATDWLLVFTNLASGAWTFEQAAEKTGLSVAIIQAQVLAARKLQGRMFELAGRIITRYGMSTAAETGGGGALASFTAWAAGISTTTLVVGAGLFAAAGLGYGYYWSHNVHPTAVAGPRMTGADCPDKTPRMERCPWTPASAEIQPCAPGYCFDGGFNASDACKPENQHIPNAHLSDLNDLICNDGYPVHVTDPCTGLLLRCDPPGSSGG